MARLDHSQQIGRVIYRIRREMGLSQEAFAKRLGRKFTQGQISRWERGRAEPVRSSLARIAEIAKKDISIFWEEPAGPGGMEDTQVIDPELAKRIVEGIRRGCPELHGWLLGEIGMAFKDKGVEREDWPTWLRELRDETEEEG